MIKVIIALLFILTGCSEKMKEIPVFTNKIAIKKSEVVLNAALIKELKPRFIVQANTKFGEGFIFKGINDTVFFVKSLQERDMKVRKVYISATAKYDFLIKNGQQVFLYNAKENRLKDSSGKEEKVYNIHTLPQLYPMYKHNYQLVNFRGKPQMMFNYSVWKINTLNYLDSSVFIIQTDSNQYVKIGKYARDLRKKRVRSTATLFDTDTAANIYYIHEAVDTVYKMNTNGEVLAVNILDKYPKRDAYKKNKGDLAYIRKYEYLNDKNSFIKTWNDRYVIVLKELAADKMLGKKRFKFFVYDIGLNKLYEEVVEEELLPAIFLTKAGFNLVNIGLTKSFNHEF